MDHNITIVNGENKFNFRVAVLIENKNRFLLETAGEFWNMIGGRVQFGESSLEAAKRELKEELNIEVDNLTFINVSENFFEWLGSKQQEVLFVYKVVLSDEFEITSKDEFQCLDSNEMFKWHNKASVANLVCKPEIIKDLVCQDEAISHQIKK